MKKNSSRNPRSEDQNHSDNLVYLELRRLLEQYHEQLQVRRINRSMSANLYGWLSSEIKGISDFDKADALIQSQIEELMGLQRILRRMRNDLHSVQRAYARRERFSEQWWQRERVRLQRELSAESDEAIEEWHILFAEALVEWRFDVCRRLAGDPLSFPEDMADAVDDLLKTIQCLDEGIQCHKDRRFPSMIESVSNLEQQLPQRSSRFEVEATRSLLFILIGRICLLDEENGDLAEEYFDRAAYHVDVDARIRAGLGFYELHKGDLEEADRHFRKTVEAIPDEPDGYLGLWLLEIRREKWQDSTQWLTKAQEALPETEEIRLHLDRLAAPLTDNLYLLLAMAYVHEGEYDLAQTAVESAEALGSEERQPDALELKGRILRKKGNDTEAADAYYLAGRKYIDLRSYEKASDLLQEALDSNSRHIEAHWFLAESLRMLSYVPGEAPYVNPEIVEESQQVWQKGAALVNDQITYADSWVYITRARIASQLAKLPNQDKHKNRWQAVTYCEQALLHFEDHIRWSDLSNSFRILDLTRNAKYCAHRAVELKEDDNYALEAMAGALIDLGEYDQAHPLLEQLIQASSNEEIRSQFLWWKALTLWLEGKSKDSYRIAEDAWSEKDKTDVGRRTWWADIKRVAGIEAETAKQDYEWVYEQRRNDSYKFAGPSVFGQAAYYVGHLDDAFTYFQKAADQADADFLDYFYLTLSYMAKGDAEAALKSSQETLDLATNKRHIDVATNELKFFEDSHQLNQSDSQSAFRNVRDALQQIRAQLEIRREEIINSPQNELEELGARADKGKGLDEARIVALKIAQARLYLSVEKWDEALRLYRDLQKSHVNLHEAALGIAKVKDAIVGAGQSALTAGDSKAALETFQKIGELDLEGEDPVERGNLCALMASANTLLEKEPYKKSQAQFAESMAFYAAGKVNVGKTLGETVSQYLSSFDHYWLVDTTFSRMQNEIDDEPANGLRTELLAEARTVLRRYLDSRFMLPQDNARTQYYAQEVDRIVVEIDDAILPDEPYQEWELFKSYLPNLRDSLLADTGVRIPSILIRSIYKPNSYSILIDEIPRASESIELNGDDPFLLIVNHLEAVLRQNLALFLGLQEVNDLVGQWKTDRVISSLVDKTLPDQKAFQRFARLLRAMVGEGIPINQPQEIIEIVHEVGLPADTVHAAYADARRHLKQQLPGNNDTTEKRRLPEEWEREIAHSLVQQGNRTLVIMSPIQLEELLEDVGNLVTDGEPDVALVVQENSLRLSIRRLLETEFPQLIVLARDELIDNHPIPAETDGHREGEERRRDRGDRRRQDQPSTQ